MKTTGITKIASDNSGARVYMSEITDRRNDHIYPARIRLLLYLQMVSRGGKRPVRLTNEAVAEIGLSRQMVSERVLSERVSHTAARMLPICRVSNANGCVARF
jgi:hypothetical protein